MSDGFSYAFRWNALSDACPKCRQLNGREWHDQDLFQGVLWDSIWGNIWNLDAGHSLAHPNCRCQLSVRVNVAFRDLQVEFENLLRVLRALREELERRT